MFRTITLLSALPSFWLWAPPCPQRWTYNVAPATAYLDPLFLSDSAGDLFWWELGQHAELVAVREGTLRWRRRLSSDPHVGPFMLSASLMADDLLVVSYGSTVEGRRTSDGRVVWSRDLRADLGVPDSVEMAAGAAARMGGAVVTAVAAGRSAAWLLATASDGRILWRTRITGAAARLSSDADRLYALRSEVPSNSAPIFAVDSSGKEVALTRVPFRDSLAVSGREVVFDQEQTVTALVAPLPITCPPGAPCRPSPSFLTVTGFRGQEERWHISHPAGLGRVQVMLLSDRSVLLVDNERVGRISPDGDVTQLCELPLNERGSVVGLIRGNLMVAYHRSVSAFTIPGAPELAASGWVMRGGGPAQGWAPVSRSAAEFFPFPAGVFDPHTQVAYVPTDGGATQALALADGAQRWRTPSPARPVAIWHGRVIVLRPAASALEFAELDPANGALLATSQPIPLPAWVPRDMAPWGDPLVTTVQVEGDRARLDWEAFINGGSGGAQIPPHGATGRSEVDLASGAVSLSPTQMVEGARPIPNPKGPLAVVLGGRKFTLTYLATGTLTATDARSGKKLWTKTLWSIAPRVPILAP